MMRPVVVIALVLTASAAPLFALGPLIAPGVWAPSVAVGLGIAAVVLAALRIATRLVVWPTVIAFAASYVGVFILQARGAAGASFVAGRDSVSEVGSLIVQGAQTLRTQAAPVEDGPGVGLIVALVVTALFVAGEALALGAESPALAGIPLLLLWAPHVVLGSPVPTSIILVAGTAYLAMIALASVAWPSLAPAFPIVAGVTAVTVLSSMILTPWALSAPSWLGGIGSSSSTRLDLGLDIREDLVRGADTPLIHYEGLSPEELGPIHSHTLADFDGQRWHEAPEGAWLETSLLFPEGSQEMVDPEAPVSNVHIRIDDLGQDRLFLPEAPRQLHIPMPYDPFQDEVYAPSGHRTSYGLFGPPVIADPVAWHEKSLEDGSPSNADRYLQVPQTSKQSEIEALTEEIIEGAESPYEKAVAIQDFFRRDDRFEYTTTVPSVRSDDAVWDFLEHGQGYCVQFATAMTIIARTAGIPARMAVGFLPGTPSTLASGNTGGVITSHDAHTWPQLYLGGAGWARFEPTPSSRTGPVPEAAAGLPVNAAPEDPEDLPTNVPAQEPEAAELEEAAPSTPAQTSPAAADRRPTWPIVLAAALVAAAGVWFGWRWRARSRSDWGPEEYWNEASGVLRKRGLHRAVGDTPTAILERARELPVSGSHGEISGGRDQWVRDLEGFSHLTDAVNAVRYAPPGRVMSAEDLQRWLDQTREAVDGRG